MAFFIIYREGTHQLSFVQLVAPLYINVLQYGADPTGTNDSTSAIQAAISAASSTAGSAVFFPAGVYLVSSTITFPGNIALLGSGDADGGTIIKAKASAALTTPVLASADWYNNSTTCGNPVEIRDIKIDGNSANSGTSGTAAHGIVMMNFWSIIERCSIIGATGDGLQVSAHSRNGTHITNTSVETKISRLQIRSVGGNGIRVNDNGSPQNSCTDGFIQDCIITAVGARGISMDVGAGWILSGNHIYSTVTDAITINKCYATRVIGNYIDGYGSGSSTFIAGISMSCIDGRGSSCIANHVGFESSSATGPYQAIRITGAGSATSICLVTNNTVRGNSASGSLGYVLSTNVSQQGFPWLIYFHDNDAQAVSSYSSIDSFVTGGDFTILNHATLMGPSPTAVAGAGAGTTPPAPILNVNCTDVAGLITWGTGTTPATGSQVVVTFNKQFAHFPFVILQASNPATAALQLSASSNATTFTVSAGIAPAASQANTTYGFYYHVLSHQ